MQALNRQKDRIDFSDAEEIRVRDKSPFLRDYPDPFSEYVRDRNGIANKTKESYQAGIDFLREQSIADLRIHMIRKSDVETVQFPKAYAGSTVNRALRTLRRALNLAVELELMSKCPKFKLVEEYQRKQTISGEMEETITHQESWLSRSCWIAGLDRLRSSH
jgi:hypothetical protein